MLMPLVATWVPALLIGLSGALKLSGNPKILETMTALGVGRHVRLLGVMELAFATMFIVPATMKLGFLLASCYFGGAIATELSHDALKANPFVPMVVLWIGAFVRDRSIFSEDAFDAGLDHQPCDRSSLAPSASSAIAVSSFGSPFPSRPGAFVIPLGRPSSTTPLWRSWSRDVRAVRRAVRPLRSSWLARCGVIIRRPTQTR